MYWFVTLSPSLLQGHLDLTVRGWSILVGEPGYVWLLLLAYVGGGVVHVSADPGDLLWRSACDLQLGRVAGTGVVGTGTGYGATTALGTAYSGSGIWASTASIAAYSGTGFWNCVFVLVSFVTCFDDSG